MGVADGADTGTGGGRHTGVEGLRFAMRRMRETGERWGMQKGRGWEVAGKMEGRWRTGSVLGMVLDTAGCGDVDHPL